jgi:hypothetical protein
VFFYLPQDMPLKRKTAGGGKKGSSKKPKLSASPSTAPPKGDSSKTEVFWALPTEGSKNNQRDESEATTRYAQVLYNQPWDAIRPAQRPFRFPALRTPVYKAKGKDLVGTDTHRSSAALRELFNTIKHATEGTSHGATGPYTREAFNRAFDDAGNDVAIVASQSAASPILTLDQDYRVEV